jgi:pyrimidine operon attenuation protein/uracil phosphoribosyltransferase
MADVLKKVITGNDFKNGTAVVSIDKLGVVTNHTLDTAFNQISQITVQSGVLDSRLDDVRYYTGDATT